MSNSRLFWYRVRIIGTLLSYVLSLILIVLGVITSNLPKGITNKAEIGQPQIVEDKSIFRSSAIEKVVNDDKHIYAMFGDNGLVKMYTLDGDYIHSLYFYSHQNGVFDMSLFQGELVVKDKVGNLYTFKDGAFDEFYERKLLTPKLQRVDFDIESTEYSLRAGSVWHTDSDGKETRVIKETMIPTFFLERGLLNTGVCLHVLAMGLSRLPNKTSSASENNTSQQ